MQTELKPVSKYTKTYATEAKARETALKLLHEGDRFMIVPVVTYANEAGTVIQQVRYQIIFEINKSRGGYVGFYAEKGHFTI